MPAVQRSQRWAGDLIRRRGENIDPAEIERATLAIPGVRRAAVIGVAGELDDTDIHLFIEADPDEVTEAGIRARCAQVLAPFKRPQLITITAELPLGPTYKPDKQSLRARAATAARSVDADLDGRLARLDVLGREIERRADELTELAMAALPFPRSVIRADINLAVRRLAAFDSLAPALSWRRPLGTVALSLPSDAILSNPVATVGSSYLAGNETLVRPIRQRAAWSAVVTRLLVEVLGDSVRVSDAPGQRFVEVAMADDGVGALMIFGDDRWVAGYEPAARRTGTKLIFEGPGKDPFLVLDPSIVSAAAEAAAISGLYNAGQARTAPKRFYVVDEAYPAFLEALVAAVERLSVGHPADAGTRVGPLDESGATRVLRQVTDAATAGGKVLTGGSAQPTTVNGEARVLVTPAVVADCGHHMSLLRDETLGPVLPVVRVESAEVAVQLAEDSRYGLAATVYGGPSWVRARLATTHGEVYCGETWLDRRERAPVAARGGRRHSGWVWEWIGDQFVRRDGPRRNVIEFSRPAPH